MYGYIYKIENLINKKVYIGQTTQDPEKREYRHFRDLHNHVHGNFHLQNSFNKYWESNFKFSVLTWANSKEELDQLETYFINKYECLNPKRGYNIRCGGSNGKHSEETKQKISKNHKGMLGKSHSPVSIEKMRDNNAKYWKGKSFSKPHRNKISNGVKTKLRSEHIKLKMSENHWDNSGIKHPLFNKRRGKYKGTYYFNKNINPWNKVWKTQIKYNGKGILLGHFNDPISGEIVYKFVFKEIYAETI